MSAVKKRREPEHSVRIVYLVAGTAGHAIAAWVTRADARRSSARLIAAGIKAKVIRCEVVETKRKGGGA